MGQSGRDSRTEGGGGHGGGERWHVANKKKTKKGRNLSEDVNPWLTPEETEQSEPVAAVKETQEALERLVEQEKEEEEFWISSFGKWR